ncbi:MAG: sulfatase-like hydrolase/transferase, partial [Acidobacteriota bacterium]
MKRATGLLSLFAVLALTGCSGPKEAAQVTVRPNIVLIMSDDMGFSDLGCYGGEIKTPNLDGLARDGLRLTQFYNTARCCPTRASLMTGLYPHQAGMGWMTAIDSDLKAYQGDLSDDSVTLAQVAKSAGYSTFMAGKWHVARNEAADGPKHNWPLQRGFDRFFGTIMGAGSYFDPATLCRGNTMISPFSQPSDSGTPFYYTDAITDEAVRFVTERDTKAPFFMYVAYTAAHWPMQARPEAIEKYKGVYDAGWQAIREQRFQRMKELGVISPQAELSPLDVHPWGEEKNPEVESGRMEVYAAMVDEMDQGVGRIVGALKDQKIFENTVVLFLQDNGGCAEEIGSLGKTGPWAEEGANLEPLGEDEIQTEMIPHVTRDGKPVMRGVGIRGGDASTYVSYGKVWANASNTPFREYKHWVHEGGISTPLIIHY